MTYMANTYDGHMLSHNCYLNLEQGLEIFVLRMWYLEG